MVICCVPRCGTDSWRCDTSITFHDFPSNPDLAAKWIKQINTAFKPKPMWLPRGRPVICSKHFLHTDFKGNTDALKPKTVPTIFGHKYIGQNAEATELTPVNVPNKSPLIVKVIRPQGSVSANSDISEVQTQTEYSNVNEKQENNEKSVKNVCASSEQITKQNSISYMSNTYVASNQCKRKLDINSTELKNGPKRFITDQSNIVPRNNLRKKEKMSSDLIEIGPNTFLKINPDIIKVNKRLTPSGNTVLQFLMDQNLAKAQSGNMLPKLIQGTSLGNGNNINSIKVQSISNSAVNKSDKSSIPNNKPTDFQHVLGHLVDTHICEESCADLDSEHECMNDSISIDGINESISPDTTTEIQEQNNSSGKGNADTSILEKAPVLLTTNLPISHCFMEKPKYLLQLKQKNRQIASLKFKVSNLTKKIEELEDRCIVQERQLSYSFIKRLKTIRKNAAKGDPTATYILEQIRSYTNNSKMRWSDSTLTQCAIWCRKAPYAYEYFKKADFFKLPCLGTVKRFMKKHPEIKFQRKQNNCNPQDDDDSSSDFDFDESDNQNNASNLSEEENEPVACETILSVPSEISNCGSGETAEASKTSLKENGENSKVVDNVNSQSSGYQNELNVQNNIICHNIEMEKNSETSHVSESNGMPLTVDSSNLELQEIILPSGEVVQCYSSSISNGADAGSQYFIIPNVSDQNTVADHEYSVVQADSLPVILQNLEHSQLHLQQPEQLIFITNSADQVECSETEVTSA